MTGFSPVYDVSDLLGAKSKNQLVNFRNTDNRVTKRKVIFVANVGSCAGSCEDNVSKTVCLFFRDKSFIYRLHPPSPPLGAFSLSRERI